MELQKLDMAPENWEGRSLALSDVIRTIKKYLWLAVVSSVSFGLLAFLWSNKQPKQYDATAMIEVDQHGGPTLSSSIAVSDEYELKITTEMLALQSHDVAMNVIKRLNLQSNKLFNKNTPKLSDLNDPQSREYLLNQFARSLEVKRVPKSQLISVTFRTVSPVLSAEVANSIVDSYLEENFQHHFQGSKDITGWLTNELSELKSRVQDEQSELLKQGTKLGLFSGGESTADKGEGGTTSLYQVEMEGLLEEMVKAQTQKFIAAAQYDNVRSASPDTPLSKSVPGSELLTSELTQLTQIQNQEAGMVGRYGAGYAPLQALKKQEAALTADIAKRREAVSSAALGEFKAAKQTEEDVEKRISGLKAQAQGLNPDAVRYQVVKSQYAADQTLLNNLLTLVSAGGIEAGLKTKEVNRMSAAVIPFQPSRPRILLNTAAGIAIGLLLAGGIITVIIAVSDTVETVEQIEETVRLPMLGVVPAYKFDVSALRGEIPLAVLNAPRSASAEAYRTLRTSINLIPAMGHCRVVGITSCGPGEGKSTTALNLAIVAAQQNKRVLLIDGDLRKPILAKRLRTRPSGVGLGQFLSESAVRPEDVIQDVADFPNLKGSFVWDVPPFPSELLGQGKLEELIRWGRENFDIIIIDSPPALLVTDAFIIAQSVDILLVVARVGVTQARALRRVRQELSRFPGKQIGVVVNAVPETQSYYTGYGGYHGYYGSDTAERDSSETHIPA